MDETRVADDLAGESGAPPERVAAARRLLERDGSAFVLRPWQAGYLITLAEGRDPGPVPLACGLGAGWLEARLTEAMAELDPA